MIKVYLLDIEKIKTASEEYCRKHFPIRFEKSLKYRFPEDRLRCIGAGMLLYEIMGLEDRDILTYESGKPYSVKISEHFSISHSGSYSVLATGKNELGADIEIHNEKHLDIAGKIFTEDEISWMGENNTERFFKLWTLKESICKATGKGISLISEEKFSVMPVIEGGFTEISGKKFYGKSIDMNGYGLSVCMEKEPEETVIEYPDFQ